MQATKITAAKAIPLSNPNCTQGLRPSRFSKSSANQKMVVSNRADKLVSHTHRVHQYITYGNRLQNHADHTATFSPKHRRPIKKMGIEVSAEKMLLMSSSTIADRLL